MINNDTYTDVEISSRGSRRKTEEKEKKYFKTEPVLTESLSRPEPEKNIEMVESLVDESALPRGRPRRRVTPKEEIKIQDGPPELSGNSDLQEVGEVPTSPNSVIKIEKPEIDMMMQEGLFGLVNEDISLTTFGSIQQSSDNSMQTYDTCFKIDPNPPVKDESLVSAGGSDPSAFSMSEEKPALEVKPKLEEDLDHKSINQSINKDESEKVCETKKQKVQIKFPTKKNIVSPTFVDHTHGSFVENVSSSDISETIATKNVLFKSQSSKVHELGAKITGLDVKNEAELVRDGEVSPTDLDHSYGSSYGNVSSNEVLKTIEDKNVMFNSENSEVQNLGAKMTGLDFLSEDESAGDVVVDINISQDDSHANFNDSYVSNESGEYENSKSEILNSKVQYDVATQERPSVVRLKQTLPNTAEFISRKPCDPNRPDPSTFQTRSNGYFTPGYQKRDSSQQPLDAPRRNQVENEWQALPTAPSAHPGYYTNPAKATTLVRREPTPASLPVSQEDKVSQHLAQQDSVPPLATSNKRKVSQPKLPQNYVIPKRRITSNNPGSLLLPKDRRPSRESRVKNISPSRNVDQARLVHEIPERGVIKKNPQVSESSKRPNHTKTSDSVGLDANLISHFDLLDQSLKEEEEKSRPSCAVSSPEKTEQNVQRMDFVEPNIQPIDVIEHKVQRNDSLEDGDQSIDAIQQMLVDTATLPAVEPYSPPSSVLSGI